jgi:Ulp1 family protease
MMSTSDLFSLLFFNIRIWRKEKHLEECQVYFFTTFFYTALAEGGTKRVTSWTTRKNLDIFKKKYIFIPVNLGLHWSLCCVVNPGFILNNVNSLNKDQVDDKPYPCILFFDSLLMHPKLDITSNVRKWLNSEWKKLKKWSNQNQMEPFTKKSLLVHAPKGKFLCYIVLS